MILQQQDLSKMLETAIVAARLAGQRAMEELSYLKTSAKTDDELVTQADSICQEIIINRIKETYPDHGFIAEEGSGGSLFKQTPRTNDQIWWVIDPIDGTNNYAHQMLCFAVSIAVMHEGKPIVGVIFDPATDSMFTAVKGSDAQLNGRKITAGDETISKFASIGLDSHFDPDVPPWACEIMKRTRHRNLGTTVMHLAYVARGALIGAVINRPKLWDIAAGAVIIESAGAVISDWHGQKIFPVDLDKYQGELLQVMAANKKVYPELAELLKT